MGSDSPIRGCLTTVATAVGIITGLLTIVTFLSTERESVLEAWAEISPVASQFLEDTEGAIQARTEAWPWLSWVTGIGIVLAVFAASWAMAEEEIPTDLGEYLGILVVSALGSLVFSVPWVWVFSGSVDAPALLLLLGAGAVAPISAVLLHELLYDFL